MNQTLIQAISTAMVALGNCEKRYDSSNREDAERAKENGKKWLNRLTDLEKTLPSGSGIDNGTKISRDVNWDPAVKIKLTTAFHHMDDNGFYDGWTDHEVIVSPTFEQLDVTIKGVNKKQIKDYLHDVYYHALHQEAPALIWANL